MDVLFFVFFAIFIISTLLCLHPPFPLKDLSFRRKGIWDRIASVFGYKSISFAYKPFQDNFWVRGPDIAWARRFFTSEKMNWLLRTEAREEFHMREGWLLIRQDRALHTDNLQGLLHLAHMALADLPSDTGENPT